MPRRLPVPPAPPSADGPLLARFAPGGALVWANDAARAFFALDSRNRPPRLSGLVPRSAQPRMRALAKALADAESAAASLALAPPDGTAAPYTVTLHAVRDDDGTLAEVAFEARLDQAGRRARRRPAASAPSQEAPSQKDLSEEPPSQEAAPEPLIAPRDAEAPKRPTRRLGRTPDALAADVFDLDAPPAPVPAPPGLPYADAAVELLAAHYPMLDALTHAVPFPLGIAAFDPAGEPRLAFANDAVGRAFGRSAAEVCGHTLLELVGDTAEARTVCRAWTHAFHTARATRQPQHIALELDGRFFVGTAAFAHLDASGETQFVFFFTDETALRQRVTALTERLRAAETAASFAFDSTLPPEETPPPLPAVATAPAAPRLSRQKRRPRPVRLPRGRAARAESGSDSAADAALADSLRTVLDAHDALSTEVNTLREANEALSARAEELDQARRAAEQAAHAKSAFLATISHEIRDPLNGILGMVQVLEGLEDAPLTPEQTDCVTSIGDAGQVLLSLVHDILDVSKMEAERIELEHLSFDLHALAHTAMHVVRPMLHGRARVALALDISPGVPTHVVGDEARIRQVIMALLSNAAKFTPQGTITLRLAPSAAGVRFEVNDTGTGIASDVLATLFRPAEQARRPGSTGMGLTVARGLVELMGGTIEVKSAVGVGSTFRFTIPLLPAMSAEQSVATPGGKDGGPSFSTLRILLAEDNLVHQKITLRVLDRLGVAADVATNGAEVLDAMRTGKTYHVVLMDVQMPIMDGFETTAAIRAMPLARQPYVVALTGTALGAHVRTGRASGMDAFVAKPISVEHLAAVLRAAMSRRSHTEPVPA